MGLLYKLYLDDQLDNNHIVFCCRECKTHLSHTEFIVSKAFQGHYGRAWLFQNVYNIFEGSPEDRSMTTGLHTVRDIYCQSCGKIIGWKYEKAYEESQKYKEGKYILERVLLSEVSSSSLNPLSQLA